jgi:septal ring factor EnvC (AmiA/AmiB activator)
MPLRLACLVFSLVVIVPPALLSCATTGDLDQLKQEIQASAAKVETSAKRQLQDREAKLAQDLKSLQDTVSHLTAALKEQQAKLAEAELRNERLARDARELRIILQSASKRLTEFLRTEESKLKDRLRWVKGVLKGIAIDTKPGEEKGRNEQNEGQAEGKK